MYWNIRETLTYNRLINVIVGNRGGGKTYGSKEYGIDTFINDSKMLEMKYIEDGIENFIKYRQQFGYIRRFKEDLQKSFPTLFDDIKHNYPDYEFKVQGSKAYIRLKPTDEKEKWKEEDIACHGFTLSTANNLKSISFPYITLLIYDEFILEKGLQNYLPNEPEKLLNLYETIARPGTSHPRVRLFMLANAITISNPYFLYWDLKMPKKKDKNGKYIWLHKTLPILVEDVRNEDFIDKKKNTEFGTLVSNTSFGAFSIDNKFLLDDDKFIEKKGPKSKYYFTFTYKDQQFGVWADFNEGKLWVSKDVDPSFLLNYSLTLKDHTPNTLLINTRGKRGQFKVFIEAYKNGCVRFESINIKNITYEVIKMVLH